MIEKPGRTTGIPRASQGDSVPTNGQEQETEATSQRASVATDILTSLAFGDDYSVGGTRYPTIPMEHLGATLVRVGLQPPRGQHACSIYEAIVEALGNFDRAAGAPLAGERLATLMTPLLDKLSLLQRLRCVSALKTVAAWGDALERGDLAKSAVSRNEGSWSAHVICAALRAMILHEKRPIVQMILQGVTVSVQQASQIVRTIHEPGELVALGSVRQSMSAQVSADMELLGRCYAIPDSYGVATVLRRVSSDSVLVCEGGTLRPLGYATAPRRDDSPKTSFSKGVARDLLEWAPPDRATSQDKAAWVLGVHERVMRALARDVLDGVGSSEELLPQAVAMWSRLCPSIDTLPELKTFLNEWDARLDSITFERISALKDMHAVWARKLDRFEQDLQGELQRIVSERRLWWDYVPPQELPMNRFSPQEEKWHASLGRKEVFRPDEKVNFKDPSDSAADSAALLNTSPPGWEDRTKTWNRQGREWVSSLLEQFSLESEVTRKAALMVEIVKGIEVAPEGEFPPDLKERLRGLQAGYEDSEESIKESVSHHEGVTSRAVMERAASLFEHLNDQTWQELRDSTMAALRRLEGNVSSRLQMLDVHSYDLMATDPSLFPFTSIPVDVTEYDLREALGDPKFESLVRDFYAHYQDAFIETRPESIETPPGSSDLRSLGLPPIGWWERESLLRADPERSWGTPRGEDPWEGLATPSEVDIKRSILATFRADPDFQEQLRGLVLQRRDQKKFKEVMKCLDDPEVRTIIERNLCTDLNTIPRASQIHLLRFLSNSDDLTLGFLREGLAKHQEIAPLIARSMIAYAQNEKAAMALLGLAVMLPKEALQTTLQGFLRIVDAATSAKLDVVKLNLPPPEEAALLRQVERQTLERANSLLIDWEKMLRDRQGDTQGVDTPFVELARQVEGESVVFAAIFKAAVSSHAIDPSKIGEISICQVSVDSLNQEDRERMATMQEYNGVEIYSPQFNAYALKAFTTALGDPRTRFWLLKINDTIEGFVRFVDDGSDRAYFGSLNLSPTVDSFGLGGILLRETLNFEGSDKVVWGLVTADNPVRGWYRRFGFEEGKAIENYDIGLADGKQSGVTLVPIVRQQPGEQESKGG